MRLRYEANVQRIQSIIYTFGVIESSVSHISNAFRIVCCKPYPHTYKSKREPRSVNQLAFQPSAKALTIDGKDAGTTYHIQLL
jgi:hypothetical protein